MLLAVPGGSLLQRLLRGLLESEDPRRRRVQGQRRLLERTTLDPFHRCELLIYRRWGLNLRVRHLRIEDWPARRVQVLDAGNVLLQAFLGVVVGPGGRNGCDVTLDQGRLPVRLRRWVGGAILLATVDVDLPDSELGGALHAIEVMIAGVTACDVGAGIGLAAKGCGMPLLVLEHRDLAEDVLAGKAVVWRDEDLFDLGHAQLIIQSLTLLDAGERLNIGHSQ